MAWVTGIREVRHVAVPAGKYADLRRGPVVQRQKRVTLELPPSALGRTISCGPKTFLPEYTGAGPCGTLARRDWKPHYRWSEGAAMPLSPLAWSVAHLVDPLAAYYARYTPPLRFGAKPGPRGRRVAA